MSLLNITGKAGTPMQELVANLRATISELGTEFASRDHTRQVISMEGLQDAEMALLNQHATGLADTLKSSFQAIEEGAHLGMENLSSVQIEAGTMVALAAGNPIAYAEAALKRHASSANGVNLIDAEISGVAGRLDYRTEASLEAFDEKALNEMIPYSIAFNVQASRQDEFSETFYPTTVVSPEHGGIDMTINRTLVFNQVHHNTSGKVTDFQRKPLVEAAVDASILADESTSLVPHLHADNSNADLFVAPTLVAPSVRKVGGVDVPTAPLKMGQSLDLLGVSQHPQLLGAGIIDHTDAIDSRISLSQLYLQNGTEAVAIAFPTARLPRSGFIKTAEGNHREMGLQFSTSSLVLNADTKAVDGSAPTSLQAIRDGKYTVRLTINVDGRMNVETGETLVYSGPITVAAIFDASGNEISKASGAGKSIADGLAGLKAVGYELIAARTNSNRRTRGLLLTTDMVAERFAIPLAAPISAPSPMGSNRDTRDLDSLIAAARIRNSNNAVTTLLNYAESLRAYVANHGVNSTRGGVPEIEGLGRFVVRPFFEEVNLDVAAEINSLSSKDRAEDISALLINAIRDVSYRMYRDSSYQIALDSASVGSKDATLIVGTDAVIQRHLMLVGDTRTFGSGFKNHKVVTSWDSRIAGKIILTFGREGATGAADALSFGTHAWIPELATSMQVTRDGAMYTEAMVQPRTRHINNLPVMAIINVTGLEDVLAHSVAIATKDTTEQTTSEPSTTDGSTTTTTTTA